VAERTPAWLNRYRRLKVRYEGRAALDHPSAQGTLPVAGSCGECRLHVYRDAELLTHNWVLDGLWRILFSLDASGRLSLHFNFGEA